MDTTTKAGAHTPGPWTAVEHSWSRTGIYAGDIGIAALDIEADATEETQYELEAVMRANANLIASAPLMLEALLKFCRAMPVDSDLVEAGMPQREIDELCNAYDDALVAVRAAQGAQS